MQTSERMSDTPTSSARRQRTGLWIAADIVVIGAIVGSLWWRHLNAVPTVDIPNPPMPSPNGFDVLLQAGTAVKDEDVIQWAGATGKALPESRQGHPISSAEIDSAIEDNQGALSLMRQSLTMPYRNPAMRTFDARLTGMMEFRRLARLLNLEGERREAKGDLGGAVQSRLDAIAMGADQIPQGGVLIQDLVGFACQAIGRRPLWTLANTLNADDARAAARRMEKITAQQVPLADVLTEEKCMGQAGLLDIFRKNNVFQMTDAFAKMGIGNGNTSADSGEQGDTNRGPSLSQRMDALRHSKADILQNYTRLMDAQIARTQHPYTAMLPSSPRSNDPISEGLVPVVESSRFRATDTQAQNALLTIVFALRAYQATHHDYPTSLSDLMTDGTLTAIPTDPFSPTGEPLRYRRLSAEKYLLYSVGPNGRDEGGAPIVHKNDSATQSPHHPLPITQMDTQGDYVVGVNLY